MNVMMLLVVVGVAFNWIAGVILFEYLHARGVFSRFVDGYTKSQYCKVWVIGEAFLYLFCGPAVFVIALLTLWTIGVSHYYLCASGGQVAVLAVIKNIPAALRKATGQIRPYIR